MKTKVESKLKDIVLIWYILFLLMAMEIKANYNHSPPNEQYNILVIFPVATRSHRNSFMGTVKALAARNHQVTVLSTLKDATTIPNVRDMVINGPNMHWILSNPFLNGSTSLFNELLRKLPQFCSENLASKEVQEIKEEKFDLIIISPWGMNDCFFSLVHHFKVPYVFISPNTFFGGHHTFSGSIHFESLAPSIVVDAARPPTYIDRLKSTSLHLLSELWFTYYTLPMMRKYCEEAGLCSSDIPPFMDFYNNNSLVIINSVKALENPAHPWMSHVIHAGGIHCRPANKLPKELEQWIEDSGEEGFIYFSMGSIVSPSTMPERYRDIFLKVFGSLKYKVLWKWDQEIIDGLPSNVKLSKWLPQQDILGHPKVRLFITHGGLLSTQEATYHGVPVLGIPLFLDQFSNIRQIIAEGWGEGLTLTELSEDLLRSKILSVVENTEMKRTILHRSTFMRDRLNQPSDEVAYWIEYVIRHYEGEYTTHYSSRLYVWQLYNSDVWALLFSIFILIMSTIIFLFKKLFAKILRPKNKVD